MLGTSPNTDQMSYDAENRETQIVDNTSNTTVNYTYDGSNQRVSAAIVGGTTTVFVYDASGQLISQYSSGTEVTPDCQTCYLSYDRLGSTRLVTDEVMGLVARHDYLAFGEEAQGGTAGRSSEWDPQDNIAQKFTGQIRDVTGLDFFKARYFSSTQGRFNSVDPHNAGARRRHPQSWNAYPYVWNNPLRFTGADGKCLPCPEPPPAWEAPGAAHGSTTGTHWHWIEYNQNPATCECFPVRRSSPTRP